MSACEILSLYTAVNSQCIEKHKERSGGRSRKNRQFENITKIMLDIIEILKQLVVEIKPLNERKRSKEGI